MSTAQPFPGSIDQHRNGVSQKAGDIILLSMFSSNIHWFSQLFFHFHVL